MNHKFRIITLGCKVNQYESEAIAHYLQENGYQTAADGERADICIINTCTVTHRASMQSRQTVRQTIRAFPDAVIVVTGCYAQTEPEVIRGIEGVHYVVGHSDKHRIPDLVLSGSMDRTDSPVTILEDVGQERIFRNMPAAASGKRTRPFLKIQDGCNAFCAYCIVPYTRGRSRSMPVDEVLANIRQLKADGFREVVISGIHVGCYGKDLSPVTDLEALLRRIHDEDIIDRVRISSIEPHELTDGIIDLVASSGRFCRHFHIPLQSGDNGILKQMGRPYTREFFRERILYIHDRIPDAAIGVDTLIGFPGEDNAAFENTLNLIDGLPVSYLHVFPFSPRPGTPAAGFPNPVSPEIIKARCSRMRELGHVRRQAFYEKFAGKSVDVLFERERDRDTGMLKGVSSNYLNVMAHGPDDLKNTICPVIVEHIQDDNTAVGSIMSCR